MAAVYVTRGGPPSRGHSRELVMTKMEVLDLIAQHTRDILPGLDAHQFVASDRLVDLGANSVDRAEIAMLVQESLGLSVPRVELFGPKNIGELADLFLKRCAAA
jgi:polyketide biosynthesis acyl carrier protein